MTQYIETVKKFELDSDWYKFTVSQVVSVFELEVAIALQDWTSFTFILKFFMEQMIGFRHTGWAMNSLLAYELPIKYRVSGVKVSNVNHKQLRDGLANKSLTLGNHLLPF